MNSDGTTFYDPETSQVKLEDVFGAKTTNATLGSYNQVQSGYYYDSANSKFYVGSDKNGTEIYWNQATNSFKDKQNPATTHSLKQVYGISNAMVAKITGNKANATVTDGTLTITGDVTDYEIDFSTKDGTFTGVGARTSNNKTNTVTLNMSKLGNNPTQFDDITIDFSGLKDADNGGKSTAVMSTGSIDDGVTGKGKKLGAMIGISIDNNGLITGTYDNGNTETLGQIAVAQFANASGLEKVGENCYRTTLNSGEFDGIGVEISADGSSMTSGELEMSNVDLSTEFTQMIITQRGFQANSRIITTSDTLLEELVNLKR